MEAGWRADIGSPSREAGPARCVLRDWLHATTPPPTAMEPLDFTSDAMYAVSLYLMRLALQNGSNRRAASRAWRGCC